MFQIQHKLNEIEVKGSSMVLVFLIKGIWINLKLMNSFTNETNNYYH